MYRGFNIKFNISNHPILLAEGKALFTSQKQQIEKRLNNFLLPDKILNGNDIQKNWFPEIDAEIFLSHSHADEDKALILAAWLYKKIKLKTFIDSSVWGYSNNLLKIIDNQYCRNPNSSSYSYDRRNQSTSHVHLMLSAALNKMIDNCECILFLSTPNSISSVLENQMTASPWIYMEMATTQTIRKRRPKRVSLKNFSKGGVMNEDLIIEYELELSHLSDLTSNTLQTLSSKNLSPTGFLDELYRLLPLNRKNR